MTDKTPPSPGQVDEYLAWQTDLLTLPEPPTDHPVIAQARLKTFRTWVAFRDFWLVGMNRYSRFGQDFKPSVKRLVSDMKTAERTVKRYMVAARDLDVIEFVEAAIPGQFGTEYKIGSLETAKAITALASAPVIELAAELAEIPPPTVAEPFATPRLKRRSLAQEAEQEAARLAVQAAAPAA